MSKPISQREARQLRKRVAELEQAEERRRRMWSHDYPGGTNITTLVLGGPHFQLQALQTARLLGHAVVAIQDDDLKTVRFYALPLPKP